MEGSVLRNPPSIMNAAAAHARQQQNDTGDRHENGQKGMTCHVAPRCLLSAEGVDDQRDADCRDKKEMIQAA